MQAVLKNGVAEGVASDPHDTSLDDLINKEDIKVSMGDFVIYKGTLKRN